LNTTGRNGGAWCCCDLLVCLLDNHISNFNAMFTRLDDIVSISSTIPDYFLLLLSLNRFSLNTFAVRQVSGSAVRQQYGGSSAACGGAAMRRRQFLPFARLLCVESIAETDRND